MIDLNNLDYDQREQLANLKFDEETFINERLSSDEISEEVKEKVE